jgi:hypothetical protein
MVTLKEHRSAFSLLLGLGVFAALIVLGTLIPLAKCPLCEGERHRVWWGSSAEPISQAEYDRIAFDPRWTLCVDCTGCNGRGRVTVLRSWLGVRWDKRHSNPWLGAR